MQRGLVGSEMCIRDRYMGENKIKMFYVSVLNKVLYWKSLEDEGMPPYEIICLPHTILDGISIINAYLLEKKGKDYIIQPHSEKLSQAPTVSGKKVPMIVSPRKNRESKIIEGITDITKKASINLVINKKTRNAQESATCDFDALKKKKKKKKKKKSTLR
eukprot:TRINITY_DN39010_c0_g1_i1.p1 TRINITY_DN39010_c0_g1~~TRINITY_DN39010_c0_g1_i1.p1  ORF type:complete len:160 (+),score=49.51 TRINITY_DN39010_c0_g1_i1:91-570(+)